MVFAAQDAMDLRHPGPDDEESLHSTTEIYDEATSPIVYLVDVRLLGSQRFRYRLGLALWSPYKLAVGKKRPTGFP